MLYLDADNVVSCMKNIQVAQLPLDEASAMAPTSRVDWTVTSSQSSTADKQTESIAISPRPTSD